MNSFYLLLVVLVVSTYTSNAQKNVKFNSKKTKTLKTSTLPTTSSTVTTNEIKAVPVSNASETSISPNSSKSNGISVLEGAITAVSSSISTSSGSKDVTESMAGKGLKEALKIGADLASNNLGKVDGFLANEVVKIVFPPEAKKVESRLRSIGMGGVCDDVITSVNRAAESAVVEAKPILISAITNMSMEDALGILKGSNVAATEYLRRTTGKEMASKFKPIVEDNLNKSNATKYWGSAMGAYNQIPFVDKVNPDLTDYVTQKTVDGIFIMVAEEEKKIRENPLNRTTDLIKNVFGWADTNK